jgi:HSP20 family protein
MANLVRKENREVARGASQDYRFDPFRVMDALLRWDPFRDEWGGLTHGGEFTPRFDVKETKDAYVIKADLPGVKEGDLEVSLNGNMLSIRGRREEERKEEGENYYALERSSGSFTRSFTLPASADGENVSADLREGVLEVKIPKTAEAQPKKVAIGKGGQTGGESTAKA